jgi:hypothetical protein
MVTDNIKKKLEENKEKASEKEEHNEEKQCKLCFDAKS